MPENLMADLKFACPHCQQHIQAPEGYAGMQISCPTCHGVLLVPEPTPLPPSRGASLPVPPPPARSAVCPSCEQPLPRGAMLCLNCGYNTITRQRTLPGRAAIPAQRRDASREPPWYLTPYPYVGALLVVLALLYYLGRENRQFMLAFMGIAGLYYLATHILIAVYAFRHEGITYGLVTLCIPFVAFYYVLRVCDNDTLRVLYGLAVAIFILAKMAK